MRVDLSESLVHFTKGESEEDAYETLRKILWEQRLVGGSKFIRGGHRCVCFSETPLGALSSGLVNTQGFSRYSPFGILFQKNYIFSIGGRPVIYQPDSEFSLLPPEIQWRHVRLELECTPPIDFTWEREWRIPIEVLEFSPAQVIVILPNESFKRRLDAEICGESFYYAWSLTTVLGDVGWMYDTGNPWLMDSINTQD
ncbi:hypothetical protein [Roseimicrobium sp. ORNL1]|uniref:hypothetical protein n=1 Tax=Roseimicrobium sp. ORNL1 TaxID=2711231 RepID=UPI0013E14E6C|nr:hypothetical protein [Roseimicrobium sp. ORNL1]QIF04718.1 hypothetical protein G5S37_25360 [Roseimicrobium sp. ORNL1]